ncbi:NADH:ubiquinone reductase (Na(+)-transporting) subunit F [Terriglobus sp. TAA 43]|uniref:NADH:ubiquinone reductase (Na(+)-transporting) subunit F n=1 Tax=Terriglobus sp. TAA 43 TaxID=278961 RepID=UPI000647CA1F|nr:NADH:ubiquinone reductase (Na(+)-transporting) subunit F [Terriglobus sp. TAA 43]
MSSTISSPKLHLDYSLTGVNSKLAIEKGLAEADWYQSPVSREAMRQLLERRDGPAIRDTLLWFALIGFCAYLTWRLWGSWWAILPYLAYAALYGGSSDSRWHESGHGTAFRTDWMNTVLYEVSSFMVLREATVWRWSHTRHHSDTIIVGRDPEISIPRPPDLVAIVKKFVSLGAYPKYVVSIVRHSFGIMSSDEKTFIPQFAFSTVYWKARVHLAAYIAVLTLAVVEHSFLPILMVGLANLFGAWLMVIYSVTQHAGLAENVLDHRLNCRTVYMNPINRFLYWNMNYHIEHHMYPLVPFHNLPRLHALIKDDCPAPYPSLYAAWKEIVPAVWKQIGDPTFHVKRVLPQAASRSVLAGACPEPETTSDGWVIACTSADVLPNDVVRFDHGRKTFAVCRDESGAVHVLDGICSHGNVHLSGGLVKGNILECPKHNGRFYLADGSPARTPVCRGVATYEAEEREGLVHINLHANKVVGTHNSKTFRLRVVSNDNVATFIKELVLEPDAPWRPAEFSPGDYLQIEIPGYDEVRFSDFTIPEPFAAVWHAQHVFDHVVSNRDGESRWNNYSIASNLAMDKFLRFNVRIATPPPGQACPPGVGSSYLFHLKPGDHVTASGPFGDFHIRPTLREMVYIGGGAGMAPIHAHISHLLETEQSSRRVSFWYGARSGQELFYDDYFRKLEEEHPNFTFQPALSALMEGEQWDGHRGFIHDVVREQLLQSHVNPAAAEYYLCGPPMMMKATTRMLSEFGVPATQITFDEF